MIKLKLIVGPFLGGVLFAIGLGVGGMTEPQKILGFLDVFGDWHPDLLFVMIGAVLTYGFVFPLVMRSGKPLWADRFELSTMRNLDRRLIVGAALFGVGWGFSGLCPGPGLVSLVSLKSEAFLFVIFMLGGMILGRSSWGEKLWRS